MSEKRLAIDGLELNYKGLFDLNSLLKKIDQVLAVKGYGKEEKRRTERIKDGGKEFSIELRPAKAKTAYYALMIKIRINITNMKEVEVEKDGIRSKLEEGDINILFDAWAVSDFENRWEQKPLFYFVRNMFDRFIYRVSTDRFVDELVDDTHYVHNEVKAHLNLHQF